MNIVEELHVESEARAGSPEGLLQVIRLVLDSVGVGEPEEPIMADVATDFTNNPVTMTMGYGPSPAMAGLFHVYKNQMQTVYKDHMRSS